MSPRQPSLDIGDLCDTIEKEVEHAPDSPQLTEAEENKNVTKNSVSESIKGVTRKIVKKGASKTRLTKLSLK